MKRDREQELVYLQQLQWLKERLGEMITEPDDDLENTEHFEARAREILNRTNQVLQEYQNYKESLEA